MMDLGSGTCTLPAQSLVAFADLSCLWELFDLAVLFHLL